MAHLVEELQAEAARAIAAMREAALATRTVHARAELMRHMRTTAVKVKGHRQLIGLGRLHHPDRSRDYAVAVLLTSAQIAKARALASRCWAALM